MGCARLPCAAGPVKVERMRQESGTLTIQTSGRALIDVTGEVAAWFTETGIAQGVLTLMVRHTSASLTIQENAAREVRSDILLWLDRLAPEGAQYDHDSEGADDMPAHLKAMLTGVTLSIPVLDGGMRLGTWQGIYLCEHRVRPHRREIALHLIGK